MFFKFFKSCKFVTIDHTQDIFFCFSCLKQTYGIINTCFKEETVEDDMGIAKPIRKH